MTYRVYILYSQKLGSFYKGQTVDINDRMKRHNSGYEKSTASGCPWKLIWITRKPDRAAARVLERKLKNLSKAKLLAFMLKYYSEIIPEELDFIKRFEP
ncbi:MAG: GIY-YIG nuclease family protein [Bacteroidota bacterium]